MTRKPPTGLSHGQLAAWYRAEADRHWRLAERWATLSMVCAAIALILAIVAAIMAVVA